MLYGISIVIITIIIAIVIIISFRFFFVVFVSLFFGGASVSSSVLSCHVIFVCPSGMFVYLKTKDYHLCSFYCTPSLLPQNSYVCSMSVSMYGTIFSIRQFIFCFAFLQYEYNKRCVRVCVCVCHFRAARLCVLFQG